jgi:divalent metal cation (Fe/Co/Zn/Cd) transporter
VLLEDVAALIGLLLAFVGVGLTWLTGNSVWDAIGTLAIGALLVLVAIVLGIETKSLLVGEGATDDDDRRIREAINAHPRVEALIHMKTLYLGPDELMVAAKVAFESQTRMSDVATDINALEVAIREAVPVARVIYIEPDIFHGPTEANPSTDAIVIRGAD